MFGFFCRLLERLRPPGGSRHAGGDAARRDGRQRGGLSDLLRVSAPDTREMAGKGVAKVEEAAERASATVDRATAAVRGATRRASDRL